MNTSLNLAVNASIPIINIVHSDLLHVGTVLSHVLNTTVVPYPLGTDFDPAKASIGKAKLNTGNIYFSTNPDFKPSELLYNWLVNQEKTLILVNHTDDTYAFDAGGLRVPDSLIKNILKDILDTKTIEIILPVLQGLTIKSITELIRITTAKDNQVTVKALNANRHFVVHTVQGLVPVDKKLPLYFPNVKLQEYTELNKAYFLSNTTPEQLVPRGILLNGIAGSGKTLASKFIANEFEAPLYRLDLSASLSRFVGDSERNLSNVLSAIQQEPLAVLLIDEIEKLFGDSDDSGVTTRLLAQLLWFLQEHKGRVFTVMTSNDMSKLPPELYRSGRIDEIFTLTTLTHSEAIKLALAAAMQLLGNINLEQEKLLLVEIQNLQDSESSLTPALITNTTYTVIKKQKWLL